MDKIETTDSYNIETWSTQPYVGAGQERNLAQQYDSRNNIGSIISTDKVKRKWANSGEVI